MKSLLIGLLVLLNTAVFAQNANYKLYRGIPVTTAGDTTGISSGTGYLYYNGTKWRAGQNGTFQDLVKPSVSLGTFGQVPYMNAAGTAFQYSSNFTYGSIARIDAANTLFLVGGSGDASQLTLNSATGIDFNTTGPNFFITGTNQVQVTSLTDRIIIGGMFPTKVHCQSGGSGLILDSIPALNDTASMILVRNIDGEVAYRHASTLGGGGGSYSFSSPLQESGGTVSILDASLTQPGIVTTSAQSFAGNKTFNGILSVNSNLVMNGAFTVNANGGITTTDDGPLILSADGSPTAQVIRADSHLQLEEGVTLDTIKSLGDILVRPDQTSGSVYLSPGANGYVQLGDPDFGQSYITVYGTGTEGIELYGSTSGFNLSTDTGGGLSGNIKGAIFIKSEDEFELRATTTSTTSGRLILGTENTDGEKGFRFDLQDETAQFIDETDTPGGLEYNVTGYVTQTHSLTDKEYVDGLHKYGELYIDAGSTVTTVTTAGTFYKITGYSVGLSSGTTPASGASSNITIATGTTYSNAGVYNVSYSASFTGTANAVVQIAVFVNGTRQPKVNLTRKISAGGDVGRAACSGLLSLAEGDVIDVRVTSDSNGDAITVVSSNLNITRTAP